MFVGDETVLDRWVARFDAAVDRFVGVVEPYVVRAWRVVEPVLGPWVKRCVGFVRERSLPRDEFVVSTGWRRVRDLGLLFVFGAGVFVLMLGVFAACVVAGVLLSTVRR